MLVSQELVQVVDSNLEIFAQRRFAKAPVLFLQNEENIKLWSFSRWSQQKNFHARQRDTGSGHEVHCDSYDDTKYTVIAVTTQSLTHSD